MTRALDRFHGALSRAFADCDGVHVSLRRSDEGAYLRARVVRGGDEILVETFGHEDEGQGAAGDLGRLLSADCDDAVEAAVDAEYERLASLAERGPLTPEALRAIAASRRSR